MRRPRGEGSYYQRKDGRFVSRYMGSTRYTSSSRDAIQALADLKREFEENRVRALTVMDTLKQFLNMKSNSLKAASYDRLEDTINCQLVPRIGDIPVEKITDEVFITAVLDKMKIEGLSYSSIKKAYDAFNACMRYCVAKGLLKLNPLDAMDSPRKNAYVELLEDVDSEGKVFAFDKMQRQLFVAAANIQYSTGTKKNRFTNRNAYIFMMYSGLRIGEMLALKWMNVNFETRVITVKSSLSFVKDRNPSSQTFGKRILIIMPYTKTNIPRSIKLNTRAFNALMDLKRLAEEKSDSEFVVSNHDGTMLRPNVFEKTFAAICDIAGIKLPAGSNVHILRHTFASMLFANGVHVRIVSELLGHSSTQITMNTYIHLIQDQNNRAIESIDID